MDLRDYYFAEGASATEPKSSRGFVEVMAASGPWRKLCWLCEAYNQLHYNQIYNKNSTDIKNTCTFSYRLYISNGISWVKRCTPQYNVRLFSKNDGLMSQALCFR